MSKKKTAAKVVGAAALVAAVTAAVKTFFSRSSTDQLDPVELDSFSR